MVPTGSREGHRELFQANTVFAMMFWLLTNPSWDKVHYGVPKREGSKKDAATGSRTAFVTRCLDLRSVSDDVEVILQLCCRTLSGALRLGAYLPLWSIDS